MTQTLASAEAATVTQDKVLQFLDDYRKAYEKGDESYFSYFNTDASLFTVSSPTRIDSREEFKRSFGPALTSGVTRRCQIMAPEIRILGDSALVTCHNRISVDDETISLRVTFVMVLRGHNLRIAHMHASPLPQPTVPGSTVHGIDEIDVLEERVATSASQIGTPK
jgi:ketosteroid isomerase-like protein